jgi:hypothetical protein
MVFGDENSVLEVDKMKYFCKKQVMKELYSIYRPPCSGEDEAPYWFQELTTNTSSITIPKLVTEEGVIGKRICF